MYKMLVNKPSTPNPLAPKKVKHNNKMITFCVLGCAIDARLTFGADVMVGSGVSNGGKASPSGSGVAVTTR